MEWTELLSEVLDYVIPVVGVAITGIFTWLGTKVSKWFKSQRYKLLAEQVLSAIESCVLDVYQTYVQELKESDSFNEEEQATAKATALAKVNSILTTEQKEYLKETYDDYQAYLEIQVESSLASNKTSLALNKKEETTDEETIGDSVGVINVDIS